MTTLGACTTQIDQHEEAVSPELVSRLAQSGRGGTYRLSNGEDVIVSTGGVGTYVAGVVCPTHHFRYCFRPENAVSVRYSTRHRRPSLTNLAAAPGAVVIGGLMLAAGAGASAHGGSHATPSDRESAVEADVDANAGWITEQVRDARGAFSRQDGLIFHGEYACSANALDIREAETDAEVRAWIWEHRFELAGSCLIASRSLWIGETDRWLDIWMIGQIRTRWERLHCSTEWIGRRPLARDENGQAVQRDGYAIVSYARYRRILPNAFVVLNNTGSRSEIDATLERFFEAYDHWSNDLRTYAYAPPTTEICEPVGGTVTVQQFDERRNLMRLFGPFNPEPGVVLYGDRIIPIVDANAVSASVEGIEKS